MTESGQTLGPYQLEDALGGTRTVFRARHVVSGDVVCVKLLPEHLRLDAINRGRRKRELLATKQVRHDGVGRPLDFVDAGGRLFLVMDYVEGAPLSMALFGGVTLPVSRALRVVRGACEAVAAAHAAHATHGCLEPDKLLLGQDGLVYVVGFGFRDEDALKNPGSDAPADVDLCTAPERWSGAFETPEADVWGLGALLYRCLSGTFPFEAETRTELSHRVQTTDVVPPSFEAGPLEKPAIETVVLRALSRDPVLRYPDAAVLARALVELEGMLPPEPEAAEEAPLFVAGADVEPIADDPPPPPQDDEAIAALAALEEAIQSHEAFVDPFAAGLLKGPEELFSEGPKIEEPNVEAPEIEVPKIEAPKIEVPRIEVPKIEESKIEVPKVEAPKIEVPKLDAPKVEAPMLDVPKVEAPMLDVPSLGDSSVELPMIDGPSVDLTRAELPSPSLDDGEDIDVEEADAPAEPLPLPPPLADRPVVVSVPELDDMEPRRPIGVWAAAVVALVAVVALLAADPLGLFASDAPAEEGAGAATALTAAATAGTTDPLATEPAPMEPSVTAPASTTTTTAAAPASDGGMNAALLAAAADAGLDVAADAGAPAQAAPDGDGAAQAGDDGKPDDEVAELSPKERYASADEALERALEERGLLWKDSTKLDRLRLRARRQAKSRRYQAAARTTESALEAANDVAIDERLVKRKLLRYVKRRKQTRDEDVVRKARALETRARKHLKDDEPEKANELLNAGLRLMYRDE